MSDHVVNQEGTAKPSSACAACGHDPARRRVPRSVARARSTIRWDTIEQPDGRSFEIAVALSEDKTEDTYEETVLVYFGTLKLRLTRIVALRLFTSIAADLAAETQGNGEDRL